MWRETQSSLATVNVDEVWSTDVDKEAEVVPTGISMAVLANG
jgi:hypothetical protein